MVSYIENEAPPWPGFDDVWIPVNDDMSLHGRLGLAHDGDRVRDADCIVILPGIFGDLGVTRTRDLAEALVAAGHHALALEMRGAGRTEFRHPDKGFTFGVYESIDMIAIDEWLRSQPHVRRTGLVGYCWGANVAMLAAWIEAAGPGDPSVGDNVRPRVPPRSAEPHFAAGVIAFSPVLHFEKIIEILDTPRSAVSAPILYGVQSVVADRMERKGYGPPLHSLRRLIDREFVHSSYGASRAKWRDATQYLRLVDYKGDRAGDKFERVRAPLLIVHAANDPLIPAPYVAEFISKNHNPEIAAVLLPSGGHVGLATWSRPYYYSLIMNFFDRRLGPAAPE
jgi:predicted alpha/beta-fold hydrolase